MANEIARGGGFAPTNLDEAMRFSGILAKSAIVPKAYQGKPEDIFVAVQFGQEIGLAPMQALQTIACINGRPAVFGDGAMALVRASVVCEDIIETMEGDGDNMTAVCVCKRRGASPVTGRFSVADAKKAGLWGKQGPWSQYPLRMLRWRAFSFSARDAFADVLKGVALAEEVMDLPPEKEPIRATVSMPALTVAPSKDVNRGHDAAAPAKAEPEDAKEISFEDDKITTKQGNFLFVKAQQASERTGASKDVILKRALQSQGVEHRKDLPRAKMDAICKWIDEYDVIVDGDTMPLPLDQQKPPDREPGDDGPEDVAV